MAATEKEREREMLTAFCAQARKIMSEEERFLKDGAGCKIGIESEVAIYDETLAPCRYEEKRDALIGAVPGMADVELGAAQVEFRTSPVDVAAEGGYERLANEYKCTFASILSAAHDQGCSILRSGANPFLPVLNTPRTNRVKYQVVPDFYNQHRPKDKDTLIGLGRYRVNIGDAAVVTLFQSFQVNLEARSFFDACAKMNRSFFIAPYLLAMSGNARYLSRFDSRMNDVRMMAWERSHDTRMSDLRLLAWGKSFDLRNQEDVGAGLALRVGLPGRYFTGIEDYFNRMARFPFIMHQPEAALKIAIGMTWLDARVKFIDDSAVVELRLLSTQPTIEEELLLTLLYLGRLKDSETRNEPLLPMSCVRENRLLAMLYGRRCKMWFLSDDGATERLPYGIGMRREIGRSRQGLEELGLAGLLDEELLERNIRAGSPSDRLAERLGCEECVGRDDMRDGLRELGMLV